MTQGLVARPAYNALLDEVQGVEGWEDIVRRLRSRPNTQVTITGSNARVLSGTFDTVILKGVVAREHVQNVELLSSPVGSVGKVGVKVPS